MINVIASIGRIFVPLSFRDTNYSLEPVLGASGPDSEIFVPYHLLSSVPSGTVATMYSAKHVVEVKTLGHWRPYVTRGTNKAAEFVFKALADSLAERLSRDHNLETQVVPK